MAFFCEYIDLGISVSLTEQVRGLIGKVTQGIEVVLRRTPDGGYDWQFYTVFAGVFGFAVYSLVDLFVGDS